jgi:hypothetical protein
VFDLYMACDSAEAVKAAEAEFLEKERRLKEERKIMKEAESVTVDGITFGVGGVDLEESEEGSVDGEDDGKQTNKAGTLPPDDYDDYDSYDSEEDEPKMDKFGNYI